jgi:hypothetical protein
MIGAVPPALARMLGIDKSSIHTRQAERGADLVVSHAGTDFVVEVKSRGDLVSVQAAAFQLGRHRRRAGAVPLVAVPLMGQRSAAFLRELGLSWLDLAGNADISGPRVRIRIMGQPGAPRRRGRPADPFAPKRARVSHLLLQDPTRHWRQQALANASGLDRGYVSRAIKVLVEAGLVRRQPDGEVGSVDARLWFEAWRDAYRFSQHDVTAGHVGVRSGEELVDRLARLAESSSLRHALTALPAAFVMTGFGGFRLVTMYLAAKPPASWLSDLQFRSEPRGANLWLVVPRDEGVLLGAQSVGGAQCVDGVQVSLDLKDHPERSAEADEAVRRTLMPWSVGAREA